MILTKKNRSTWRKTCPTATMSTANPKQDCHRESANGLSPGTTSGKGRSSNIQKNSLHTSQRTQSVFIATASQLALYTEIIANCSQIHTKHINVLCWKKKNSFLCWSRQHWALKCQDIIPFLLVKGRLVKHETCVLSILMFMECSM